MEARLYTRGGGYVVTVLNIPAFHSAPEILCWGARYFVRQQSVRYIEAMVCPVCDVKFEAAMPDFRRSPHEAITSGVRADDATFESPTA